MPAKEYHLKLEPAKPNPTGFLYTTLQLIQDAEYLKTFRTWWLLNIQHLPRTNGDSLLHLLVDKEGIPFYGTS